ncbi:1,6-anhydro-N-acetylmuramyl-L-alanine amidase AmpD [Parasalinivibrio latis]|uniref:1,6-anhydro-N-acetylmuramyl-L-alanine amidase AmpD n=1 Tax=Parasalinivibrio latis TaxID=2952610 RepID=UPI0030E4151E
MSSFLVSHDHWLSPARRSPSPHFNTRPDINDISLLVIHNISLPPGQFGGTYVEDFFLGNLTSTAHPFFDEIRDVQVSSHLFIRRDGEVVQFVPFNGRAWHAGQSCFDGRENCNDYSIGIELEGTDTQAYTDGQYEALKGVTEALLKRYPAITPERITGHEHIAPGRKTDPGSAFDWTRYIQNLDSI